MELYSVEVVMIVKLEHHIEVCTVIICLSECGLISQHNLYNCTFSNSGLLTWFSYIKQLYLPPPQPNLPPTPESSRHATFDAAFLLVTTVPRI